MKKYAPFIVASILLALFYSCEKSSTGPSQGQLIRKYGGISPIGDYIALTVNETHRTIEYHNYTTGEHAGPFSYSKTVAWGFQNIYITENFPISGTPPTTCHARFAMMEGVAIVLQLFKADNDSAIGWPVYALSRIGVDMDTSKGKAYNWMGFKINAATGNYEAGFAGFDTDSIGYLYGAAYNHRADIESWEGWDKGMSNINRHGLASTSTFLYNPSIVANELIAGGEHLTLIGTKSGDFICDNGAGKGGGFAVRQAGSKNWSSNYNGTYFTLVYENKKYPAEEPMQKVLAFRIQASGIGTINGAKLDNRMIIPTYTGTFIPLENFDGGPHYPLRTSIKDFEYYSRCDTAKSATIRNAYKCHGGFIDATAPTDCVVTIFFDPDGRFLFFCMFEKESGTYTYRFGFGIKDPNYVSP